MAETYDDLVIGAGQGGDPWARALADAGRRVAIIECEAVGGTCVNRGCTPTKTMVASARVAYLARRGADFGVETGPVSVDMTVVRGRKREIVEDFRSSTEKGMKSRDGIDLIYGEARFVGPKTVEVTPKDGGAARTLTAERIVINTGARSTVPSIEGLDTVPFLDSTSIMEMGAVPEHLLILGGSYIALEFGQMFRRFGSAVTIVEKSEQFLGREDRDIAEALEKILREDGIEIHTGAQATRAAKTENGVTVTVKMSGGEKTLSGSHLLVAVGRTPNADALNVEAAGVSLDDAGHIQVNERLETSAPGLWAIGDVKGGPQFTHISYDDFRILRANLLEGGSRTTGDRNVTYTMFTDPQLGRVGLSETEARKAGHTVKVATLPMTEAARAIETAETRGLMKAVVDAETGQILGAAILAVDGGEVMGALAIAMIGQVAYPKIRDAVLAHPTLDESLNNLFMTLD